MYNEDILKKLKEIVKDNEIYIDEPMKKHTSFRVGGPADILVKPKTEEEICELFKFVNSNGIKYLVKGNGSNLLVRDGGIRGLVIELTDNFKNIEFDGEKIYVQAGALLSEIGNKAMAQSLTGFEFASGIPGTLGGALAMNAGAYDGEIKNVVESVKVVDKEGNILELSNEQMEFGYRKSILAVKGYTAISAVIKLKKDDYEKIKEKMIDLKNRRTSKQPLEYPSAGSTFKRPEGYFAGKLIQDSGLKGFKYRGAQVSEKHSGFVINTGDAKAQDVLDLIEIVKSTVFSNSGVKLEEEVKILGEEIEE